MVLSRSITTATLLTACLCLTACSSSTTLPDTMSESFDTHIYENGTKLFTYTLRMGQQISALSALDYNAGFTDGRRLYSPDELRKRNRRRLKSRVEALLEGNQYCREGYIVLESYAGYATASLRGECRDAANDEERQRFPNPQQPF